MAAARSGRKPRRDIENAQETSHQQTRADQENAGEGDLRNDQRAADPGVLPALARTAIGVFQRGMHGERGHLERRHQSKNQTGQEGDQQGEGERVAIDPDTFQQRNTEGIEMRHQARAAHRQGQAEGGAAAGEHHALGDHLADQSTASRAERGANGHLLLAGHGTRQQEIRKVRADDQHHDAHGTGKHEQSGAEAAGDELFERDDLGADVVALGILAGQALAERVQFGPRALARSRRGSDGR